MCIRDSPHKTVHPFRNFLAVLPPLPYTKLKLGKKIWIHASNILCGVRGGVGPVWIGKRRRKAKVSQDFSPWMYLFGMNDGGRFSTQRIEQASVGNCLRFPDSSSLFTRELSRFFFGLYPSANLLTGSEPFPRALPFKGDVIIEKVKWTVATRLALGHPPLLVQSYCNYYMHFYFIFFVSSQQQARGSHAK